MPSMCLKYAVAIERKYSPQEWDTRIEYVPEECREEARIYLRNRYKQWGLLTQLKKQGVGRDNFRK